MRAILIDDYRDKEIIELGPDTEIKIMDYFFPCPECGNAVLLNQNPNSDICRRCEAKEEQTVGFVEE